MKLACLFTTSKIERLSPSLTHLNTPLPKGSKATSFFLLSFSKENLNFGYFVANESILDLSLFQILNI
jgi:hypothetical protein